MPLRNAMAIHQSLHLSTCPRLVSFVNSLKYCSCLLSFHCFVLFSGAAYSVWHFLEQSGMFFCVSGTTEFVMAAGNLCRNVCTQGAGRCDTIHAGDDFSGFDQILRRASPVCNTRIHTLWYRRSKSTSSFLTLPRCLQEPPKRLQDVFKSFQDEPKSVQDGSKSQAQ